MTSEPETYTVWQDGEMVSGGVEMVETVETQISLAVLTIRVFRSRFGGTDADLDLYDELDTRMEMERSRLVKQQWRDPGAEIIEDGALYSAIETHLEVLAPERSAELLARP